MLATDLFLACSQALSPVWVSFTSLQSVIWGIIDIKGHRKYTEDHCRLFTRGCESCFLSGSLNAAARGHVCC